MSHWTENVWYSKHILSLLLAPFGWLFCVIVQLRRFLYLRGMLKVHRLPVPVIVVGNITVGGTGKTPLVIWLVKFLQRNHFKPGVVVRGYGGKADYWPQQVRADSDPVIVGDEPLVIARNCDCPVAAGPNRVSAAEALLAYRNCDVIVSDDGLQHLALARDVEICVVDGVRRHGNGRCLPAGPLRESVARLKSVDFIVCNGIAGRGEFPMSVEPGDLVSLTRDKCISVSQFAGKAVHAVAGIAHAERFFRLLRKCGLRVTAHAFPDHFAFTRDDIMFNDGLPVIMTEKDAVKCGRFAVDNAYYLRIAACMPSVFEHRLLLQLQRSTDGQKAS